MEESIRIILSKELAKKFRELAMKKYGYRKGALSKLAEEMIRKYIENENLKKRKVSFFDFVGLFKIKESGVEYTRKIRKEAEKRLRKMGI